jgi:long-chain acyl-CoA synthetase
VKILTYQWYNKWPSFARKNIDYPNIPLHQLLEESANKYPDATYVVFKGIFKTFSEINVMVDRFATALVDLGVKKGDKVAIYLPNVPHYPVIFFGSLRAGAINITCNPLYTDKELSFQVQDSGATTLVVLDHPNFYPTVLKALEETDVQNVIICKIGDFFPPLKAKLGSLLGKIPKSNVPHKKDHLFFADLMKKYQPLKHEIATDVDSDPALILYTGGTTGTPKGAILTHKNFVANVLQLTEILYPKPVPGKEVYLGALPFYHSYGLTTCLLAAAHIAASIVFIPDPRAGNPPFTELLDSVQEYKPTLFHAVPTLYSALLNHPKISNYNLSSIKACVSGAAPLPLQVMQDFEKITGANLVEGWGLTETSPVATVNPMKEGKKPGSIGIPLPDTVVKVIDIDTGKDLAQGETGELAIKGPQVMKGYWNRSDETAVVMSSDGFFKTGDIGHMDEDGFIFITDRKKDMIIVGGHKVYPRDVEEVLFKHPAVANAAVIGIPDDHSGERVKGFIVLKPNQTVSENEIIEFCKGELTHYKLPKSIEIRSELPMTAIGKVLRRKLKE